MKLKMMTALVALGVLGYTASSYATTNITDFMATSAHIISYKENGVDVPTDGSTVFEKTDAEQLNLGMDEIPKAVFVETPEIVVFTSDDINVDGDIYNTGTLTFQNKDNTVNGNTDNGATGALTFSGKTEMNGDLNNAGTTTFQNGDAAINGAVANTGTINFQNGIESFDNTDWSASAGTGTVNFDSKAGIKIGENSRGKTLVQANAVTGKVNFVIDNGVVDDNGLDVAIEANQNSLTVHDNPLYNIEDNDGAYSITQRDTGDIQGYTAEQAALLKSMMNTTGNAFFDNITTLVQMGQGADVQSSLNALRPATSAASFAAFDTTASTIRAIYNHLIPANDPEILAGMKEKNHITLWGEGMYTHTRNDMKVQGFAMHQAGFALGIDTFVGSNTLLGIGYSQTSGLFNADNGGKTDLDGYTGFVYGAWKPSQFYISAMASYTRMKYDNHGTKWDADVYGGQGSMGYEFGWASVGLGARYIRVDSDSYKNAQGVDVKTKDADVLTGLLGVHMQHVFKEENGWRLVPAAHVALTYDIKQADDESSVSYAGSHLYTYKGEKMKRWGTEVGATLKLTNGPAELSVTYDGAFREKQYSNGVYGTLKYHF